jgi:hypothetical protein
MKKIHGLYQDSLKKKQIYLLVWVGSIGVWTYDPVLDKCSSTGATLPAQYYLKTTNFFGMVNTDVLP